MGELHSDSGPQCPRLVSCPYITAVSLIPCAQHVKEESVTFFIIFYQLGMNQVVSALLCLEVKTQVWSGKVP